MRRHDDRSVTADFARGPRQGGAVIPRGKRDETLRDIGGRKLPGVALLNTGPEAFNVPYAGGVQAVSGVVSGGTDGFFNSGSITVTPAGVG